MALQLFYEHSEIVLHNKYNLIMENKIVTPKNKSLSH